MKITSAANKTADKTSLISPLESVFALNELGSNMVSGYTILVGAFGTGVLETKSISDM